MAHADIHCHTLYSNRPQEWMLQKIGIQESYTTVDELYAMAKAQGMDFVTITDHDTIGGSLELVRKYPKDTFTGVEVTTYFPEDGCAIHLLIYDITEKQFQHIDQIRFDIYKLRDYIKTNRIAHSVAHPTYAVNSKLTLAALEKMFLLFDVFEGINGARNIHYNQTVQQALLNLTPERINALHQQYGIEPMSEDPWIKGITGGSDDHAGLFVGHTFTVADVSSRDEFIECIRQKRSHCSGRSNDYRAKLYIFSKIAYEFAKSEKPTDSNSLWREFNDLIYTGKPYGFKSRLKINRMEKSNKAMRRTISKFLRKSGETFSKLEVSAHEQRINALYAHVSELFDNLVTEHADNALDALTKSSLPKLFSQTSSILPTLLLSAPYLFCFRHIHQNSHEVDALRAKYVGEKDVKEKKLLWFTDTISDLNGVSYTLRNFAQQAHQRGYQMRLAVSVPSSEWGSDLSSYGVNLTPIGEWKSELYKSYTMRFPSLLKSLETIFDYSPSEIIISTPGPVGLIGLLAAKLMGVRCSGIYHSNFTRISELGVGGSFHHWVDKYIRWFYAQTDEIRVPTDEMIQMLKLRGYDETKMTVFNRGIDTHVFHHNTSKTQYLKKTFNIKDGLNLLYVGRVSKDKSIDFLVEVFEEMQNNASDVNLIIAGDGPMLQELKQQCRKNHRIIFTGRLDRKELPFWYSLTDVFVFPSTMDTFGMSVLEAQSCGVPAIVTDVGGPQEIIQDGKSGFVLKAYDKALWREKIEDVLEMKRAGVSSYNALCKAARENVESRYGWTQAIEDLFEIKHIDTPKAATPRTMNTSDVTQES